MGCAGGAQSAPTDDDGVRNCDMALARYPVASVDVWLTPLPPLGASGASRHEGGAEWRPELKCPGRLVVRGLDRRAHRLGDPHGRFAGHERDALALGDKLEDVVLPLYRGDRAGWIWMREAISRIADYFDSQRMMPCTQRGLHPLMA
jgi:starch phosphorylase